MVRNYLKIAWRNVRKARVFSMLNIAGLGIGLTICLLINPFVGDEFSYDGRHEFADRIYRVQRAWLDASSSISDALALAVALATVSYQAIKSAVADPSARCATNDPESPPTRPFPGSS